MNIDFKVKGVYTRECERILIFVVKGHVNTGVGDMNEY